VGKDVEGAPKAWCKLITTVVSGVFGSGSKAKIKLLQHSSSSSSSQMNDWASLQMNTWGAKFLGSLRPGRVDEIVVDGSVFVTELTAPLRQASEHSDRLS